MKEMNPLSTDIGIWRSQLHCTVSDRPLYLNRILVKEGPDACSDVTEQEIVKEFNQTPFYKTTYAILVKCIKNNKK